MIGQNESNVTNSSSKEWVKETYNNMTYNLSVLVEPSDSLVFWSDNKFQGILIDVFENVMNKVIDLYAIKIHWSKTKLFLKTN